MDKVSTIPKITPYELPTSWSTRPDGSVASRGNFRPFRSRERWSKFLHLFSIAAILVGEMDGTEWTPEAIRDLRRQRLGLTQQDFAVQLHITVRTVSAWETGKKRPSRVLKHLLSELARQSSG